MNNEYIDTKQLAAWLALKPQTAYRMAEAGVIPSYKLGKLRRFRVSEIEEYMRSCKEHRQTASG